MSVRTRQVEMRGTELLNLYIAEGFLELSVDPKTVANTYYQDLQFLLVV